MALQQQQQPVVLSGERPIMPVVSVGGVGVGVGVATTSHMNQVQQSQMSAVQQLPLQVIKVTVPPCWINIFYFNVSMTCNSILCLGNQFDNNWQSNSQRDVTGSDNVYGKSINRPTNAR